MLSQISKKIYLLHKKGFLLRADKLNMIFTDIVKVLKFYRRGKI